VDGSFAELAYAYGQIGQSTKALEFFDQDLATVSATGHHSLEPEMHRIKGELLLMQDSSKTEADRAFRTAIDVARRQSAKSWELRATTSLSRLLVKQGRRNEARQMLSEIYNWFTEGLDTADLTDAKALLDELAG